MWAVLLPFIDTYGFGMVLYNDQGMLDSLNIL